ncbi:uncharacterized protein LOC110171321 isoform X3 [Boleophthalmus pectinirostris]|uniref:uncharacterized protein LOC110171321 isoform X3 n=1 Tax=Boleophthalmus pectinirostris TaxID=150288 RepID=UPI00242C6238|nr:uncharacterized protein LOC110171321 isoform X3 [Boleophthalmus pectinirostris]
MTPWLRIHSTFTKLNRSLGVLANVRQGSSLRPGPLLSADPCRALIDEKVLIRARFLPPLAPVTLSTQMFCEDGDLWQSYAHYNTDSEGTVNLCTHSSVGGSFLGCEPMGLFWSLKPAPGEREGLRLRKRDTYTPYVFKVSVLEGHVSPGHRGAERTELASISTERWYMAPGVKRIEIRQNGLVGTLFLPPGPGPFPAILDLWGIIGGLVEYRSALLASRGYASLSLAYLGHKDLPGPLNAINVGNAYFKTAFKFLQDHDQICRDRVGIMGVSYGGYLALRTATLPEVKPSCLICINGPVGSTIPLTDEGRAEDFNLHQKHWNFNNDGHVTFKEASLPADMPPSHIVQMEKIPCPVLYIASGDDLSGYAAENADLLKQTLNACGKGHLFNHLSYPGAGHIIEPPFSPSTRMSLWTVKPKKCVLANVRQGSSLRPGPLLSADPCRALIDEKMWIRARFLPPLAPVTLSTQMFCEDGDLWQSYAHYNTDSEGTVDLCTHSSVGGSFVGCEPMGLFWSLEPAPGEREGLRLRKRNMHTPYVFKVSVLEGHVSLGHRGAEHTELASISTERWYMAPGVKRIEIRQNGLVGTLFLPPGPGPFPAILDLWGMGGGLVEYRSALLASRGYASFSLAYLGHKDLPGPLNTINVGNTYFKTAFKFLQDHDQICRDRVGIVGFSYGGYLTLRTATLPEVKPSCLICINGPVGSTVPLTDDEGRAEDFNFHQKHWKFNDNGHVIFKDVSLPANLPPSHIVKMEKIPCPVLYIASGDDLNAYPAENADLMTECTRHTSQSRAVPKTERSIEHDLFPLVNRDDKACPL